MKQLRFQAALLLLTLGVLVPTGTAAETASSPNIAQLFEIISQLQTEVTVLQRQLGEAMATDSPQRLPRSHRKPPGFNHYSGSSRLAEPNRSTRYGQLPFYGPDDGYPSGYRAPGFWFGGYPFGFYPVFRHGRPGGPRQQMPPQ